MTCPKGILTTYRLLTINKTRANRPKGIVTSKNLFKNSILMKLKRFIILLFITTTILSTYSTAFCQNRISFEIKGKIADSVTKEPLAMATLVLKNLNNKTFKSMATDENGNYEFSSIVAASYTLSVIVIGYEHKSIAIDSLMFIAKNVELKTIYLRSASTALKEVSILAEKSIIRQKADRIIYDLKADPESKNNNVLTMMRKIPYLSLDGDDNLLMKGNSSFKVLINGKPSGSMESNLKAVLKSIPASTIEKIEVITTPPSKYDAEGLAGIINIITTKKNNNDGFNGSININQSFPVGGPGIGGSFAAKSGKFGLSAFGGGSINRSPKTFNTNKRSDYLGTSLLQQGNQRSNHKTAYLGTELSYQLDTLNLLTAQLNYNGSRLNDGVGQESELNGINGLLQKFGFANNNVATGYGIDAGINYEMGFKSIKNRLITLSYLYSTNSNNKLGNIKFDSQINFNTPDFLQTDQQKFKEHTFQVDFITPVKKLTIEAGMKGILRKNNSDFDYSPLNPVSSQYETDLLQSNSFSNTQNVFSAYNSYQLNLNSWNITAGLRLEASFLRAEFSAQATLASQHYFNIIPSLAIGKAFKNGSNLNLGFSQRIRRPGINRLNPYVDRSNPNYEVTGNPNLKPVLLNDIQLGYNNNKKVSVNIGLNYSFMNNLDLQVVDYDPMTQITRTTYANTGSSSSIGSNLNISYPVTSIYKASLNSNTSYLWLAGKSNGQPVSNNILIYGITLSNVVRLKKGWAFNADLGLNSRTPTGLQGYTNGFFYSAINFYKDIIKDKFSISGGIKNPFSSYRNSISNTFGPEFSQVYESRNYFRSFNFSLNYNFGRLKDRINKNRTGIKNNDVAN